jgi:hypothetical protein
MVNSALPWVDGAQVGGVAEHLGERHLGVDRGGSRRRGVAHDHAAALVERAEHGALELLGAFDRHLHDGLEDRTGLALA